VDGVGADAAVAAVERQHVGSGEEVGLTDDAGRPRGSPALMKSERSQHLRSEIVRQ